MIFFILLSAGLEKVSKSTAEAFSLFYEEYLPKIFKYISYRISDKFLAEDLTSTVFEKALTKYETYSSKKAVISTWVFTIARNTLIDYYRAADHEKMTELDHAIELPQENSSPEQAVIDLSYATTVQTSESLFSHAYDYLIPFSCSIKA